MSTTNCAFSLSAPIKHTCECSVLFPLHIGKGRRVAKSEIHTRLYPALQLTQGMRIRIPCGVCALESSSTIYYIIYSTIIYHIV